MLHAPVRVRYAPAVAVDLRGAQNPTDMAATDDSRWAGLAEARAMLERSRPRTGFEGCELRLRLLLTPYSTTEFPELEGADFGMQDKKGVLIPGELRAEGRWSFEVGALARRQMATGVVTFLGPYVHGPAGDEFFYLNWRAPEAAPNSWTWRRKYRLTSLTWEEVAAAFAAGHAFEADGSGRTGHNTAPVEWRPVPA